MKPLGPGLYAYSDINFQTELISIVLLATNMMKNITKMAICNEVGSSTPLYEEKMTIVESNTTSIAKAKMKISAILLFNVNVA